MPKGNYIFGLDVGSSTIKCAVGEVLPNLPLQIIGANITESHGIRKGQVFDIEDAAESIEKNFEEIEQKIEGRIESVTVSIGGPHIQSISSRGVVAVSRADGEVSEEDVSRVLKAAEAISLPKNKEILHVLPREFIVDKEGEIKDPIGMHGVRLEVEAEVIFGSSPYINNLIKAVENTGKSVDNLVFSTLAASEAVLSKRQKELGVAVLDIGAGSTGLCVFEEENLLSASVLPVGASHITNDIAIAFQLPIDIAEKLKLKYGVAQSEEVSKKEEINLEELGGEKGKIISRKELAEVIEARNLEILELVVKELKKIQRERLLPAGVILVGGGAKMPGMEELVKKELHLPCQIGFPKDVEGIVDKIDDPSFATAVGLLFFELKEGKERRSQNKFQVGKSLSKVKKWLEELLP
ncbi:MAG TPA: cell division protein FtsA [Candidatus Pacearchaeota archaeon]|nr:cell division protein FtsA [Candidatus Pacearchaeota archaeon]HOK94270.1 cell division protein FtsA [Candidatus Pacearchaeota archaeon]HPO75384.1 cell division protein FtsA [Candidatus Pacearchaeota archaeon]